jgi:hypothetical protein
MSEIKVREIDKAANDVQEDGFIFEIEDPDARDGIYYLVVGEDKESVCFFSVNQDGTPLYSDLLLIPQRVTRPPDNFDDKGAEFLEWTGDISEVIGELLGQTTANIILNKLGIKPYSGDLTPHIFGRSDPDSEVSKVTSMSFDFHLEQEEQHTDNNGEPSGDSAPLGDMGDSPAPGADDGADSGEDAAPEDEDA